MKVADISYFRDLRIKKANIMEQSKWPQNIKWWNKISDKSIEIAISQSENLLNESVTTSQSIQDRADKLLAILAPAIPSIFIYIVGDLKHIGDFLHLSALFALVTLFISFCFIFKNIKAYQINVSGDTPDVFLNNILIVEKETEKEQFLKIALLICENNKLRIETNEIFNKERSQRNQRAINILIIGLVLSPMIAWSVTLLNGSYS